MNTSNPRNRSQDLGFTAYMTFCATIAALSGFNVGWHISVPNMPASVISKCTDGTTPIGPLPACLPMSDFTWGYTVSAFALGGLAGSLATMYLNSWFGRRDNIMISCFWMILGGVLSTTSVNIAMYSIGRAFVGIASGMCGSSVAIYVSEISTAKTRGALGSLFELFLNLGILFTHLAGFYMSKVLIWRILWIIPTVIALIQLVILYFFTVECPRRLCANQQTDKAREALRLLRKGADIEDEFNQLLAAREREIKEGNRFMSIWDIIRCKEPRTTWNVIIVMVIQAYNQIGGIGPMSVYSVGFLTSVFNGDHKMATNVSLASTAGNIVATSIALIFMHKVGRKGFMLISTGGVTVASTLMVIGDTLNRGGSLAPLLITASILFTFTYSMGCGVIPWLIAPELLPLYALPSGSALGNASNWLFNFVINTIWPYMNAGLKTYSFVVFIAINLVGFLFIFFFMPETTGRDLDHFHGKEQHVEDSASDMTSGSPSGNGSSQDSSTPEIKKVEYRIEEKDN